MDKIYLDQAMDLVRAQASVRSMTADEMIRMRDELALKLCAETIKIEPLEEAPVVPFCDPKKAITEKYVTCLVCGKRFTVMTAKHLATHNLTPEAYREQFGYKKGAPLAAKSLSRARKAKMQEMKLWERRGNAKQKADVKVRKAEKKPAAEVQA